MTNLQLGYTEYLESKRHNEAEEALTAEKNAETIRHNWVTEEISTAQQELERYKADLDAELKREGFMKDITLQKMKQQLELILQQAKNTVEYAKLKQAKEQFDKNYQLALRAQKNQDKKTESEIAVNNTKIYGSIKGVVSQFVAPMTVTAKSWLKDPSNRAALVKAGAEPSVVNVTQFLQNALAVKNGTQPKSADEIKRDMREAAKRSALENFSIAYNDVKKKEKTSSHRR